MKEDEKTTLIQDYE